MEMDSVKDNQVEEFTFTTSKQLTDEEKILLEKQNSRLVTEYKSLKTEAEAKKHWDLFYKRNETRFFKDRHWTTREFVELLGEGGGRKEMLEIGCGVGNLIYPLLPDTQLSFHACDLSPRAVELVKSNPSYDPLRINVFQADVTAKSCFADLLLRIDMCTLVFVLSAIHPDKFSTVLRNAFDALKPGGCLLFRDYGLHDMAQLRFKPGHKISENLYLRQDGTRSYFFSLEEICELSTKVGLQVVSNCYVHRRTINVKEGIDVPRIFVQAKLMKPLQT